MTGCGAMTGNAGRIASIPVLPVLPARPILPSPPVLPALPAFANNIRSRAHRSPMGERRQRSGRRSRDNAQIASERMAILFREAERAAREGAPGLSDRYVSLARSIG